MRRILVSISFLVAMFPGVLWADGGGLSVSLSIRIATEDDFQDHVAGRRMEDRSGNWSIGYSNHRLTGEYDGLSLKARWNWQGKTWCRKGTLGGKKVDDCWRLDLKGDRLRTQPASGGNTVTYTIH